jgi:S1-C subfamily serine protease
MMQVVSGLGREIPSPNGKAIRGAIQTDADINAGILNFFKLNILKLSWF